MVVLQNNQIRKNMLSAFKITLKKMYNTFFVFSCYFKIYELQHSTYFPSPFNYYYKCVYSVFYSIPVTHGCNKIMKKTFFFL